MAVTKAEQAARDAVAAWIEHGTDHHGREAWDAVFKVSTGNGWWYAPTGCVWFATVPSGGGRGELVAVAIAERPTRAELRVRMGFDQKPADAPRDAANLDRERLRLAAGRVRYHESITPDLKRKLDTVTRTLADLTAEIGRLDLPNLDLDAVK